MLNGCCCTTSSPVHPNKRKRTAPAAYFEGRLCSLVSAVVPNQTMDPLAMVSSMPMHSTSNTVVRDPSQQKRSSKVVSTESTDLQETTEGECEPFFVELKALRQHSKDHLRETGLLSQDGEDNLEICLVREKHYAYLSRVFSPELQPLGRNLVALDASRPWMLYWSLHGCDLLMVPSSSDSNNQDVDTCRLLCQKVGDEALCAVVSTLEACWQSLATIVLSQHLKLTERDRSLLSEESTDGSYKGGGFGGGPGQMAHAATSYAAVLTLSIVATSEGPASSSMAWSLLERIRKPLYAWLLSLQQTNGGFRMHHDGEIDVRGK